MGIRSPGCVLSFYICSRRLTAARVPASSSLCVLVFIMNGHEGAFAAQDFQAAPARVGLPDAGAGGPVESLAVCGRLVGGLSGEWCV